MGLFVALALLSILFFSYKYLTSSRPQRLPNGTLPLPGPPAFPIVGNLPQIGDLFHIGFEKLSKKYGPIFQVRLGAQKWIVINDYEIARDLMISRGALYADKQGNHLFTGIILNGGKSITFAPYGSWWKTMRTLQMQGLRSSVYDTVYYPVIRKQTKLLVERFFEKSQNSESFNPRKDLGEVVTNTIAGILFGFKAKTGGLDETFLPTYVETIDHVFGFLEFRGNMLDVFPFLSYIPIGWNLENEAKTIRAKFARTTINLLKDVQERIAINGPDSETCVAAQLLKTVKLDDTERFDPKVHEYAKDEDGQYTVNTEDILAICDEWMLAATHTTIGCTRWMFALLAMNQRVQRKIQAEIDQVVGKGKFFTVEQERQCHYLQASVRESLRLRPVIFMTLLHKVTTDDEYRGYHIPAGTTVMVNSAPIVKDPRLFEKPEEYMPERYINENGEIKKPDDIRDPWLFGRGRRACIGSDFASRQMAYIAGYTLSMFDIELDLDPVSKLPKPINLVGEGNSMNFNVENYNLRFVPRKGVDISAALAQS